MEDYITMSEILAEISTSLAYNLHGVLWGRAVVGLPCACSNTTYGVSVCVILLFGSRD